MKRIIKYLLLFVIFSTAALLLVVVIYWAKMQITSYNTCNSLKHISQSHEMSSYLSKRVEYYFSDDVNKGFPSHSSQGGQLYSVNDILNEDIIDEIYLKLEQKHYYFLSIWNGESLSRKIGIWYNKSYLVFEVLNSSDSKILTDRNNPVVVCDAAEEVLGPRH